MSEYEEITYNFESLLEDPDVRELLDSIPT